MSECRAVTIPETVLRSHAWRVELTHGEKVALVELIALSQWFGGEFYANPALMSVSGTIRKHALARLEELGLLIRVPTPAAQSAGKRAAGGRPATIYRLTI